MCVFVSSRVPAPALILAILLGGCTPISNGYAEGQWFGGFFLLALTALFWFYGRRIGGNIEELADDIEELKEGISYIYSDVEELNERVNKINRKIEKKESNVNNKNTSTSQGMFGRQGGYIKRKISEINNDVKKLYKSISKIGRHIESKNYQDEDNKRPSGDLESGSRLRDSWKKSDEKEKKDKGNKNGDNNEAEDRSGGLENNLILDDTFEAAAKESGMETSPSGKRSKDITHTSQFINDYNRVLHGDRKKQFFEDQHEPISLGIENEEVRLDGRQASVRLQQDRRGNYIGIEWNGTYLVFPKFGTTIEDSLRRQVGFDEVFRCGDYEHNVPYEIKRLDRPARFDRGRNGIFELEEAGKIALARYG